MKYVQLDAMFTGFIVLFVLKYIMF